MKTRIGILLLTTLFVSSTRRVLGGMIPFHVCNTECEKCTNETVELDLKCGSDGIVYLNECELNCAREVCNSSLKLEHDGVCSGEKKRRDVKTSTMKPGPNNNGSDTTNKTLTVPEPICDPFEDCDCTYEILLTCGTDGETYPNECALKCGEKCNKDLKILHYGACYSY